MHTLPQRRWCIQQTVHGERGYLLCAIWVPETRVANDVFMEPIIGGDKISKQLWQLVRPYFFQLLDTLAESWRLSQSGLLHRHESSSSRVDEDTLNVSLAA